MHKSLVKAVFGLAVATLPFGAHAEVVFDDSAVAAPKFQVPAVKSDGGPVSLLPEGTANAKADSAVAAPVAKAPEVASVVKAPEVPRGFQAVALEAVDPNAVGVLGAKEGFGSSMWADTPRALVERLLPQMNLPTNSAALNGLVKKMLLTAAAVPNGAGLGGPSLSAMRIQKALEIGEASGAAALAQNVKSDQIDAATKRALVETAILTSEGQKGCDQVSSVLSGKDDAEGQKLLTFCQVLAGDMKAAQLSVDLMKDTGKRDDVFLDLMNKNFLATSQQLPRRLTPLKPVHVAMLKKTGLPLPGEVFAKAEPLTIPMLLSAKAKNPKDILMMAEKAAARGLITPEALAGVYRMTAVDADHAEALGGAETRALAHAKAFVQIEAEKDEAKKVDLVENFVQTTETPTLGGALGTLLADQLAGVTPLPAYHEQAAALARLYAMVGRGEAAAAWAKQIDAANASSSDNQIVVALGVLAGPVTSADATRDWTTWATLLLKNADAAKRQQVGNALLILSAAGVTVSEEAWGRVADVNADTRKMTPPSAVLIERLRQAGANGRKGEAVLLSALLAGGAREETAVSTIVDAVRALRLAGMPEAAQALARETLATLFFTAQGA